MATVSLIKCMRYDSDLLKSVIEKSLRNIGFDPVLFNGARVLLKPNLLIPSPVEKAIITHPEFFRAIVRIIRENKGQPVMIESPAFHSLQRVLKKTPYGAIVEAEGVETGNPEETRTLAYESARAFKQIDISSAFFQVDYIINLPKFKTHGLTYITGAVKNLFGSIPGLQKSKMHIKLPGAEEFCEFLLDLYGAIATGLEKPKKIIHLMDAVICQEGEGPGTSGTPRAMNAILAGEDAVAVDYVAVKVARLNPEKALTVAHGFEREFGVNSPEEIEIVGDRIADFDVVGFKASKGTFLSNMVRWPVTSKRFKNLFIDRPVPQANKCTLCYQCRNICPAQAIGASDGKIDIPVYDYRKCIRCYCCMEVCPEAAIRRRKGRLQWMIRI